MMPQNRREFLGRVGQGMLVAGLGPVVAAEVGVGTAWADADPAKLSFGDLEPLVGFLQETPKEKLLAPLAAKLKQGLTLKRLTAAAGLANARTFGGENYFGFHVFMALAPAHQMALELPKEEQPLPLLKVLYRNAHYTQEAGGCAKQTLAPAKPAEMAGTPAEALRLAVNRGDKQDADRLLALLAARSPEEAFNATLLGVEDNHEVHSVVLPWRAWAMLDFVGKEHALTLLRQSIHKCAQQSAESRRSKEELAEQRAFVPALLEQHKLLAKVNGRTAVEDGWLDRFSATILASGPKAAAEATAQALAEGLRPEDIGEAISLAANQLVLRQAEVWEAAKYGRRVHGDSPGVHASDTVNAWRNMARVCDDRNRAAGLILAAMNVAESHHPDADPKRRCHEKEPFPRPEQVEAVRGVAVDSLAKELDGAVRENDQFRAAALVWRAGEAQAPARPLFDVLLQYACSEDGRLHAEKYYRTVVEEFATTRPAYRWRHLTALARVTASMYGFSQADKKEGRAPGYEEARRLLQG